MKRIIALSVLGSMLAGLVSCGSDASENENNTTAVNSAVSEESDAGGDGFIPDNLPEDLDFGGQTVTILGWNHYEDIEFEAEELTGDVVNDAYYYRNLAVEDRLNVNGFSNRNRARRTRTIHFCRFAEFGAELALGML